MIARMLVVELLMGLFVLWVLANVVKALFFKAQLGGGFWGLANFMTKKDVDKQKEQTIEDEVERRLAIKLAKMKKGGKQ